MRRWVGLRAEAAQLAAINLPASKLGEESAAAGEMGTRIVDEESAQDFGGARTELDEWVFTEDYAVPLLRQQLRVHSLDGWGWVAMRRRL